MKLRLNDSSLWLLFIISVYQVVHCGTSANALPRGKFCEQWWSLRIKWFHFIAGFEIHLLRKNPNGVVTNLIVVITFWVPSSMPKARFSSGSKMSTRDRTMARGVTFLHLALEKNETGVTHAHANNYGFILYRMAIFRSISRFHRRFRSRCITTYGIILTVFAVLFCFSALSSFPSGRRASESEEALQGRVARSFSSVDSGIGEANVLQAPDSNDIYRKDNVRKGPGEMGEAVDIAKEMLGQEERKIYDVGFKRNSFNQYASDMISVKRSLPDMRSKE